MAERSSAIFWVLCPKQSLHCYSNSDYSKRKLPCFYQKALKWKSTPLHRQGMWWALAIALWLI
ncbi:MAG: hypothetical protein IM597_07200 [Pseudanabaena sp. M176S2SP2A07QC]|nr:hypothetical protein [Pseudanabaena sp. M172S2SP2A07QC]MCA6533952.1 hypothetical protein [Pseudanabaena sp. M176S2SP2A07QC]MCA6541147.1 hypothetical protein [Pseudanabaena sp. M037S2SP2A07QC]MCA6562649.1 hypothetical protein [Pseudanabaena sp. M151S2SP2A07QC]MCA6580417.1 hypothetical protein [Pseudanabaena sp. M085S1SP2A07QC]